MEAGASTAPLLPRLKYYTGGFYLARLSRGLDPWREEAIRAAAGEKCPYPTMAEGLKSVLLGGPRKGGGARHCFQHVAHLLDEAGLTEGAADAGLLGTARLICGLPGRPLADGYSYGPPVQLLYDLDAGENGAP